MRFAPETPSSAALHAMHPLSNEGRLNIQNKRAEAADALRFGHKLLAIIGPCAMAGDAATHLAENRRIAAFAEENDMVVLHRLPPWKPRTSPDSWHGHETTAPTEAYKLTIDIAEQSGALAMEFGHTEHIRRYMGQTALGWRGSRNDEASGLLDALIHSDEMLPLAIKNGMSGSTQAAVEQAAEAERRRTLSDAAPVVVIFRGGEKLRTAPDWITEYGSIFERTGGRFIVDAAHGGEQAHDPDGRFGKSEIGQLACLGSVIAFAEATGKIPRGIMIEASDIPSPTDPVVPLDETFATLERLAYLHRRQNRE